ncbi:MAG: carboxypeptidase regulatory-like domain-containing protein [Planctomycetota bacterium]
MKTMTAMGIGVAAAAIATLAAATSSAAPRVVEGTVTGTVKFEGKKPEVKPLSIGADQAKGCCDAGQTVSSVDPTLVIGAGDGIANVVITVDVPGAELKPPTEPLHIDQKKCHFEPHVLVAPMGAKVAFLNSDQVSHNVHTYASKNDSFNKTIAPGSKEEQTLAKGDRIEVKCDIHPWMSSWLVVTDTPFYAVTKDDGSFSIAGLKPGTYKGEAWHEKLGKKKIEVVVKEDGTAAPIEVTMGEKKSKKGGA